MYSLREIFLLTIYYFFYLNSFSVQSKATQLNLCLTCDDVLHPHDCTKEVYCNADKICYTESYFSVNKEVRYRMGCAYQRNCQVVTGSSPVVGKRTSQSLDHFQDNVQYCAECCSGRHCNRNLCNGHLTALTLVDPPPLQPCFDVDSDSCLTLVYQGGCHSLKSRHFLCPQSCGVCSGTGVPVGGSHVSTTTPAPISTTTPALNSCVDAGERCAKDPEVARLVCDVNPSLCRKSCGICGQGTNLPHMTTHAPPVTTHAPPVTAHAQCQDPINECQCTYMDRELSICADIDPTVSQFCCYYCNKKKGIHRCPIDYCERREQLEWSLVKHLVNGTKCQDNIGQPLPFGK